MGFYRRSQFVDVGSSWVKIRTVPSLWSRDGALVARDSSGIFGVSFSLASIFGQDLNQRFGTNRARYAVNNSSPLVMSGVNRNRLHIQNYRR